MYIEKKRRNKKKREQIIKATVENYVVSVSLRLISQIKNQELKPFALCAITNASRSINRKPVVIIYICWLNKHNIILFSYEINSSVCMQNGVALILSLLARCYSLMSLMNGGKKKTTQPREE